MRTAIAALLVLTVVVAGAAAQQADVLVSAASSLTDVLQEAAKRYEATTGQRVTLNFGASNTLARQIAAGARVDLFISADEAQMDGVASDLVAATRRTLLSNQLVVAVPSDRPVLMSPRDLLAPAIRRIAIGDPAAVPAGVYARGYLEKLGLFGRLQAKLVPSGSVRLALAAVESGSVDAAIVFRTDLATSTRARLGLEVPVGDTPPIRYPAAVVATGSNPDGARRFLAFLTRPETADIFRRAGFIVLP